MIVNFIHPLFLLGLAAVALPVVIHILTRDRIKRVAFSTLRFFAGASATLLRRRRFQELLLLAMRMAVCGLVAVAFARPFFGRPDSAAALGQVRTARAIVADVSASMARPGLTKALSAEAGKAMAGLSEGVDAAALITFADQPATEVRPTKTFAEIRRKIGTLSPSQGGTDMAAALKAADSMLRQIDATTKEIVLISDFQKVGWRNFGGEWKLAPTVHLATRLLEPSEATNNVAIVMAGCPSGLVLDHTPHAVTARVANFSTADLTGIEVSLTVGGKKADSQKINIKAGGKADVRFRHVFDGVGDNPSTVSVAGDDSDRGDNVFYFNARVAPQIAVVVIDGQAGAGGQQGAATFLRLALPPGSPFAAKVIAAATVKPEDLRDARVVVLADVGRLSPEVREAMAALLKRGGGVLFAPGEHVTAETFNRDFADLSPCQLRKTVTPTAVAGRGPETWLAKIEADHPALVAFTAPHHGDLSLPRFHRYWEVSYLGLGDAEGTRVLARFADGERPAIIERRIGQGLSMLMSSPPSLAWNDLPLRSTFLPLLHETLLHLAVRTATATAFTVGDRPALPEGHTLKDPGGKTLSGETLTLEEPGFYTELDPSGAKERVLAVNRQLSEADPTPMAPEKVRAAVETATDQDAAARSAMIGDSEPPDRDDQFWWYALLATGTLLIAELWVGNKTLRH